MSLRLDGLCVDLAGRRIVSGIDLTVGDGQFVGLLGPNGSGKSTILRAIYRVHLPCLGRVLVDGADLLALKPKDAAQRVAVVAQESVSEFDFTVREIVMTGRIPHKQAFSRDTGADHAIVDGAMERTGCAHLAYRSFNTLSGGEKQLALIARALAQGADHLILDEPTNHLDIQHQVGIMELVASLGVSVLTALHDSAWPPCSAAPSTCWPPGGSWRAVPPARSSPPRRSAPPTAPTSWSSSIRTPERRT